MGIRTLPVMTGLHRLAEKVDTWQLGDCSSCSLEIMDSWQISLRRAASTVGGLKGAHSCSCSLEKVNTWQISLRGQPPQLGDLGVHTVAPLK